MRDWLSDRQQFIQRCREVLAGCRFQSHFECFFESIEDWDEEEWNSQEWMDSTVDEIFQDYGAFILDLGEAIHDEGRNLTSTW